MKLAEKLRLQNASITTKRFKQIPEECLIVGKTVVGEVLGWVDYRGEQYCSTKERHVLWLNTFGHVRRCKIRKPMTENECVRRLKIYREACYNKNTEFGARAVHQVFKSTELGLVIAFELNMVRPGFCENEVQFVNRIITDYIDSTFTNNFPNPFTMPIYFPKPFIDAKIEDVTAIQKLINQSVNDEKFSDMCEDASDIAAHLSTKVMRVYIRSCIRPINKLIMPIWNTRQITIY